MYEVKALYTDAPAARLSLTLEGPAPIPDRLRRFLEVCRESFSVGIPAATQLHREVMECKLKRAGWAVATSSQPEQTKPGAAAQWSITFGES